VRQGAFKAFVENRAHGSAQANVSGGAILEYPVVYPGDKIARAFEAACRPILDRILRNDSESTKLEAVRDCLLPKLLGGSLSERFSNPSADEQ
jgi:type I restriction enzyme S subunit